MRRTAILGMVGLTACVGCQMLPVQRSVTPQIPAAQTSRIEPVATVVNKPVVPLEKSPTDNPNAPPIIQAVQHLEMERLRHPDPEQLPPEQFNPAVINVLTLADLEHMACSTNPSIARAQALVEAARGNWLQVGLPPNPNVGYEGQQIGSGGKAEQDGLFVQQEFIRGNKLQLNRNVACQEVTRAEHQLNAQRQRVLTDVRQAFYQVLIAQRQEILTSDLNKIALEGVKAAEALQRGKEVGKVDVLQAQLELENVEIVVENARNRSRAAWQTMAAVVGNPQLAPSRIAGEIDDVGTSLDWQSSLQHLLSNSPEIAAALAEIERARWAAQRAQVEKVPNVTVQGLMNFRDNGIGGNPDAAVSVGIPVPLWNRNQGGVIRASQEAAAAERALKQLELSLQNRLVPVFERYANANNQVTRYREKILPAAQQTLEFQRRSYQAGESAYINVLTSQRTYSQTNLNYLESLRELHATRAEIEGLLLSSSLESR